MRRRDNIALLIVTVIVAIAVTACSENVCLDNRSSIPYAGFYSYETGQKIVVDSLEIGGVDAPNDSLLITSSSRVSALYLPFRFEKDNTSFFFRYVSEGLNYPSLVDTISFRYSSMPFFESEACGAMYRYQINEMTYTRHVIDSVAITDSLITNLDVERIKIFFRTAPVDE